MKQFSYLLLALFLAVCGFGQAQSPTATSIKWHENFDDAARLSASTGKPMFLLFTGSDWCTWCQKLENESLMTKEFADQMGDKFIFVLLDFPSKKMVPPPIKQINDGLRAKYNITGFPTVILLDPQQNQINATGYKAGGGSNYADHIKQLMGDFKSYQQKVNTMGNR